MSQGAILSIDRFDQDASGTVAVVRDESWYREVRYETVRGVAITEEKALVANLVGLLVMGLAATLMPNASVFVIPLLARAAAIFGTRTMWNRLRQKLEAGKVIRPTMWGLGFTLAFGGASWALLLLPLLVDPFLHPARMAIGAGTFVGVALVTVLLSPTPRLMIAFIAGFSVTVTAGLFSAPEFMALQAFIYAHGLLLAIAGFAYASSHQRRLSAEMLVENRLLGEELADSLAHAEFLMHRDPLTGLRNRRCLFEEEWPGLAPHKRKHVLTLDLDHFKHVNDTHGHATGDHVLIAVANILRDFETSIPGGPHVSARLGGEEFVFVLTNLDRALALSSAELIRTRIEELGTKVRNFEGVTTSASIGLCSVRSGQSLDTALQKSDLAMYRAKERGRNRVEAHAA
ncbi:GGDEF domain-containing protein [Parerythrobacter aestuarii]|uniref:GGDEF domain-containing protein n=1 Tax=Parerythrobacter aestuarii TaxID=3020909 RepID=UPI0024DE9A6C|nr:GGDEF domain-containing protein [Parerythrobacter aestuarii]